MSANIKGDTKGHSSEEEKRKDLEKKVKKCMRDRNIKNKSTGINSALGSTWNSKLIWCHCGIIIILVMLSEFIPFGIFAYNKYTKPTPNTPLEIPASVSSDWRNNTLYNERLWGSYRSEVYFGMRPRIPKSLLFGMMWMVYYDAYEKPDIRHTCEHHDNLQRYSWLRHDGTSFGQQEIIDEKITLKTDFMTAEEGNAWTARIRADPRTSKPNYSILASFILYVYNEGEGTMNFVSTKRNEVEGYTLEFNKFKMKFNHRSDSKYAKYSFLSSNLQSISHLSDYMATVMKNDSDGMGGWPTIYQLPGKMEVVQPNLLAYQVTVPLPCEIDVYFENGTAISISSDDFTTKLTEKEKQFDMRFEEAFQLKYKGFPTSEVKFAKAAFSNLIGGIGYFYGSSKVTSNDTDGELDYWPAPLYTAVPSRSFFPRGFLWDEGFHQILVAHWDTTIVKDVIAHWLDLMNHEGWIPREQILGDTARDKVPSEFLVQHNENANPPTFFLTLEVLIKEMQKIDKLDIVFLNKIFPRLEKWFLWFNRTQGGEKFSTYRWRGRNSTTERELIPKTLTSGLDDFPRASHPSPEEYHVDLRCWMALSSRIIVQLAELLRENCKEYNATYELLSNQTLLDQLHWNSNRMIYSDFGSHTPDVKLQEVIHHQHTFKKLRNVKKHPVLGFVDSFGYVNLFPFFMKLVSPHSEKLHYVLRSIRNEKLLWSNYGLRSLSRNDTFYNKHNTEHDPPYWRGSIWINMNYLACRALHYYGNVEGPFMVRSQRIYKELRSNLIRNMHTQYERTGYIWEQYDDKIGSGKGTRPFTGWSSLIVLIMAEKY